MKRVDFLLHTSFLLWVAVVVLFAFFVLLLWGRFHVPLLYASIAAEWILFALILVVLASTRER